MGVEMFARITSPARADQTLVDTVPCRYRTSFVARRGGSDSLALIFAYSYFDFYLHRIDLYMVLRTRNTFFFRSIISKPV